MAGNGHTRGDEILDRPDDIGHTRVFRRVIVLIYGQDTRMFRVMRMQFFKIPWIFREQYQILTGRISKVNSIRLSSKVYLKRDDDFTSGLTEQAYQEFIVRTVVKINPQVQAYSLFRADSAFRPRPRRQFPHSGLDNRQGLPGSLPGEGRIAQQPVPKGGGLLAC